MPVTTWPDLPPEVIESPESHTNALHLRVSRVYLPVHQTLSMHKMIALGRSQAKIEEDRNFLDNLIFQLSIIIEKNINPMNENLAIGNRNKLKFN